MLGVWQGVKSVFDVINQALRLAMKLAGLACIDDVTRALVTWGELGAFAPQWPRR